MKMCYITFRSVTPAQKAERLLKTSGVNCAVVRTPRWMEEQGCGYSIRIPQNQLHRGVEVLKNNRVPYRKTYLRLESGVLEAIEI